MGRVYPVMVQEKSVAAVMEMKQVPDGIFMQDEE
jgi:hypothetical protein